MLQGGIPSTTPRNIICRRKGVDLSIHSWHDSHLNVFNSKRLKVLCETRNERCAARKIFVSTSVTADIYCSIEKNKSCGACPSHTCRELEGDSSTPAAYDGANELRNGAIIRTFYPDRSLLRRLITFDTL
jgi:hypothetical protein